MLRYLYCKEVFQEIPDEISLGISISGCQIRCRGCHSRELWENSGIPLTSHELDRLIGKHNGITCVLFMGGEHDVDTLIELLEGVPDSLKKAWYCGYDIIPRGDVRILTHLDYVKLGHYDMELGGLDSPSTNQKLLKRTSESNNLTDWENLNFKLQKNENQN